MRKPYEIEKQILLSASRLGIDADLIKSIIQNESGWNAQAVNENKNGTYDYGLGQINSANFKVLSDRLDVDLTGDLLLDDPVLNIMAMESILQDAMNLSGSRTNYHDIVGYYVYGTNKSRWNEKRIQKYLKTYRNYKIRQAVPILTSLFFIGVSFFENENKEV